MKRIIIQLKDYFKTVKPKPKYFIPMFIISFTIALTGALNTYLLARIISNITERNFDIIITLLCITFITHIIFHLFCETHAIFYHLNENYSIRQLSKKMMHKLEIIDDYYFHNNPNGKTVSLLTREIAHIAPFTNQVTHVIAHIVYSIVILIIVIKINYIIGLICILSSIVLFLLKNFITDKESYYTKLKTNCNDKMISVLSEIITGNFELKSMNLSKQAHQKFFHLLNSKIKYNITQSIWRNIRLHILPIVQLVFQFTVMGILIYLIYINQYSIDIYVVVIGYFVGIANSFDACMEFVSLLKDNHVSITRINEFLNADNNTSVKFGNQSLADIPYESLTIENLSFGYKEKKALLKNASIEINKGKITALIGENGAGKTTILKLLIGLLEPDGGVIKLDGNSIYDYNYQEYISNISLVNQAPYFFHYSIKDNLMMVCKDFGHIQKICKLVGIHDFIMSLPSEYDTILDENATNLSGGQKQKIAIARAILKNSKIILLDEFTASIDKESTKELHKLVQNLKTNHMIILITHKEDEIKIADTIYNIKNNQIVKI